MTWKKIVVCVLSDLANKQVTEHFNVGTLLLNWKQYPQLAQDSTVVKDKLLQETLELAAYSCSKSHREAGPLFMIKTEHKPCHKSLTSVFHMLNNHTALKLEENPFQSNGFAARVLEFRGSSLNRGSKVYRVWWHWASSLTDFSQALLLKVVFELVGQVGLSHCWFLLPLLAGRSRKMGKQIYYKGTYPFGHLLLCVSQSAYWYVNCI